MAEATLSQSGSTRRSGSSGLIARMAWRNLWRNRRRTWLTAGGIAFATLLVCFGMSMQVGVYASMIANATGMLEGHIQVTHPEYPDDTKLEQTLQGATELVRRLETVADVLVFPRAEAFALMSADERSFGGLVVGVDFKRELGHTAIFKQVTQGRLPQADDEILLGETMARNLGVGVGGEVVALGSAKQGGVAAMAQRVVGIYASGQAELDRTLMFVTLPTLQNAFALGDEIHKIVINVPDPQKLQKELDAVTRHAGEEGYVRSWRRVMPELEQAIQVDWLGARLIYGAILILVSFSVINTFVMVVFERTREFGMLRAIGVKPGFIVRQVLMEAFFMWLVGVAVGLGISIALVGWLAVAGIPVAGMEAVAFNFFISDRIYPAFAAVSLLSAPVVLLLGTQVAGLIATLRIRRIKPVEALGGE